MNVYGEEMILIKNSDGTYRIEVHNCPFKDLNGEEINGTIIFPRVLKDDKTYEKENLRSIGNYGNIEFGRLSSNDEKIG